MHGGHIGIGQHSLGGVAMSLEIKVSLSEPHDSMRPRAAGARDDCVAALGIPADRVRPPPLPHPSPIPPCPPLTPGALPRAHSRPPAGNCGREIT